MPSDFPAIFARLRAVLQKHLGRLSVKEDTPTSYCLQGGLHPKHKTPMPIAWVGINKNYVSYHLMPIYGCPKLLDDCSEELKARMQGKSCFNFKTIDDDLFTELDNLTAGSFAAFKKAGFM
jgi:hypothetical protein